jgi:CysZ protein
MRPGSADRAFAIRGFFYPYRGLKFLFRHPKLLSYAAIPFGINALLFWLFAWFVASRFGGWLERLVPSGDAWYWAVLFYLLLVLFSVVLILIVVYTFTLIGNLILAPFNDLLSEKVEWVYSGNRLEEPFRLRTFAKDLTRSLKAELGRMGLYLTGFVVLLSLNLFPPVGTAIYGVALPVYTLFFLGWEYLDYSMERWRFPFASKRKTAFRNAGAFLGLGAGSALLLLIPFVNLLAIPVCVTGATLLFCDLRAAGKVPQGPVAESGPAGPPARENGRGAP